MKSVKTHLFLMVAFLASQMYAQHQDQNFIEGYLKVVYQEFNQKGWPGLKQYYHPKADEIDPTGKITSGLEALELNYQNFQKIMSGKPEFKFKFLSSRMITNDVALVIWDGEDVFKLENGSEFVSKNTYSAVISKYNDKWLIEHVQLTPQNLFSDQDMEIKTISETITKTIQAFDNRDASQFADAYHDECFFVSPSGEVARSKVEIKKMHEDLFKNLPPLSQTAKGVVSAYDINMLNSETAFATWSIVNQMMNGGKAIEQKFVFSCTLVKTSNGWRARAFSIVPESHSIF